MMEEREEEACRLGRLLHDEIGQTLTAAGLRLGALKMSCGSLSPTAAAEIDEIQSLFEHALTHIRSLSSGIARGAVDRLGLASALDQLVGERRTAAAMTIRLLCEPRLHPEAPAARAMFRIAEQALDNAIRHSGATLVEVLLRRTSRGLFLEVRDNGAGFAGELQGVRSSGIGVKLMQISAERAGLDFRIQSDGAGTIVSVLEPVVPNARPHRNR